MNSLQTERDEHNIKKPYVAPQVEIYGDLRQITQTLSNNKAAWDGGRPPGNPSGQAGNTH